HLARRVGEGPREGGARHPPGVPRERMTPHVRAALRALPSRPGVYIFRSRSGRALYIGRAGDLRRRVRSYWSGERARPGEHRRSAASAAWIDPIICASEHEAAMLERNLLEASGPIA